MFYTVTLNSKRKDEYGFPVRQYEYQENFLPGMKIPERVVSMLMADFADEQLNLCEHCPLDMTVHPLNEHGYKYCTVLLHDAIKPKWKIRQLP